jgi:hypothetical protein
LPLKFVSQGITLNWLADGNRFYNVYRTPNLLAPCSLITRVSTTNFTDTSASASGMPYYYVITGLNVFGDESGPSLELSATAGAWWRQTWFNTTANASNAADTADPANDGIINIFKRAYGLNPSVAEGSGTPNGSIQGSTFVLIYQKSLAATDLHFQVESSADLAAWSTNGISDTVVSSDGSTEVHAASVPVASHDQFLRLQISVVQ